MSSICMNFVLFLVWFVTSPAFISGSRLEPAKGSSTGRTLLQLRKACTEDFENKNYTVLTSKCRGPRYNKEVCCNALKTFACPYADLINDENTNCATTMFSYITLHGNYPPGLFANSCKEDKRGLACPGDTTTLEKSSSIVSASLYHPPAALLTELLAVSLIVHWILL